MSTWAFIGFEGISNGAAEFSFKRSKVLRILVIAVITTFLLYVFVTLLSVMAYPPEYSSWLDYIRDLPNLSGIEGLPAFYAARHFLGNAGVGILMAALLSLVLSSLIGLIFIISRLFYSLALDRIIPKTFSNLNEKGIPSRAVMLVAAISIIVPFVGRTAIGWIVDVTTFGATFVYGYASVSAMRLAKSDGKKHEFITGLLGLIIMIGFALYLLVPNILVKSTMAMESYFLFAIWALLGFVYFTVVLKKDKLQRFGKSTIVWISLLSLIFFVSLVWMSQANMKATENAMENVRTHYAECGKE